MAGREHCPKCGGFLYLEEDIPLSLNQIVCIICGYRRYLQPVAVTGKTPRTAGHITSAERRKSNLNRRTDA